jgi:2-oxoglutarate ferredoxin oxidoreductase subunit gamma
MEDGSCGSRAMGRAPDDKDVSFRENKINRRESEEKILIAGFGGQGIMFLGKTLAQAATQENNFTTWMPSYGAEMRGGTAHCYVKIDRRPIASPMVEEPTIFLIFSQPSWNKFSPKIHAQALVIINTSLVKPQDIKKGRRIELPFNKIALQIGSLKVANSIALGVLIKNKKVVDSHTIEAVLKEKFGQRKDFLDFNIKAFRWGLKYG